MDKKNYISLAKKSADIQIKELKKIKPNKNVNLNIKNNIYKKFEIYSSRSWSINDDESPVKTYRVLSAIFVDLSEILSKLWATHIM